MNYKLGKYMAHTDEFEFVFDDGRWTNIDLVNAYPNYIHLDKLNFDKSKFNKDTYNIKNQNQTSYDKKCYKENPYNDNGKLYMILFNLYNEKSQITML